MKENKLLVLRLELHSAITGEVKEIGTTIIYNDGTGNKNTGNYEVRLGNKRDVGNLKKIYLNPHKTGQVKGHKRNTENVWRLITKSLTSVFPDLGRGR